MKLISIFFLSLLIFSTIKPQNMKTAFINGKIYTVNDKLPIAEAVLVEGNKIVFVGSK